MWVQKSLDMKNFIFKSKDVTSDLYKINTRLNMMQTEMRHQRGDLKQIINMCSRLIDSMQTIPEDTAEHIPEEELT